MNERRNVIAGALQGSLVLALPPRLEPVFASAAPDFWAIRTLAVMVEAPPQVGLEVFVVPPPPAPRPAVVGGPDGEEIAREVAAARERLAKEPGSYAAERELLVWLDREVEWEMAFGTLERALAAAEECVVLVRRRVERDPSGWSGCTTLR